MRSSFFDKQISIARDNYNYFFIKLVFSILKSIFKLSIMLIISSIFNYTIINIIVLIYAVYSLYNICSTVNYYLDIIKDIKNTLGYDDLAFEIDVNLINSNFFKGVVKYGK